MSRARRKVENAFGRLAARFRVFEKPMPYRPEKVVSIVKACCALHNWLRKTALQNRQLEYTTDKENISAGIVTPGNWREEPDPQGLKPLPGCLSNHAARSAVELRDKYADYFVEDGSVPWQTRMVY